MKDFSYITNSHTAYIDSLYHDFVANPESIDADLRKFFEGYDFAVGNGSWSHLDERWTDTAVRPLVERALGNVTKGFGEGFGIPQGLHS